ncbi:hypothetical protein SeLEV6574_g06934 [Synchytrium endobioticum]|uniref:MYND-type domain-containing protein n=1 Tax=Synchytrium endobioticum TaxID=286115 RepID=A0A507CML9_9FUNG|nr:hypothetical protein SeLEV6574_g06934 [Synchytrium endobioticum]
MAQLAFIADMPAWTLPKPDLDHFPSKVGGKPIWLHPHHILNAERASCRICNKPMLLLLQIYTPETAPLHAYHRCIYLFCCRNGACHRSNWRQTFKVYRSQLPQQQKCCDVHNQVSGDIVAKTCYVCGLAGTKQCGKCHNISYCSKEHQVFHWTAGRHKLLCDSSLPSEKSSALSKDAIAKLQKEDTEIMKRYLFSEYEMVIEDEPDTAIDGLVDDMKNMDADRNGHNGDALAMVPFAQEQYEESDAGVDKAFLKFQKRICVEPDQVLRYCRVSDSPTNPAPPLWVSDFHTPPSNDIPPCPYCYSERSFEFQVMPQLLNYFKSIDHVDINALDWGTIAIYTCPQNCSLRQSSSRLDEWYAEEIMWRQMFSEHGVADRITKIRNDHQVGIKQQ